MAKKQLSIEEIDEAVKGLDFKEQIRHFQNLQILLDDIEQKATEEKESSEGKIQAIQNLKGASK